MEVILLIWVIRLAGLYLLLGFLFALALVGFGLGKLDPVAGESTLGFRILIIPGVTALWPILALRWIRGKGHPPLEKNAHRKAADAAARAGEEAS